VKALFVVELTKIIFEDAVVEFESMSGYTKSSLMVRIQNPQIFK